MYTADMTAEDAWMFYDELEDRLADHRLSEREREQAEWDMEDVTNRIQELDSTRCPKCGTVDGGYETGTTKGFTGAPVYWTRYRCCGHQEVDASNDNLDAVR